RIYTMQETVLSLAAPPQLRFLFSRLILEGYPARPLWDRFENHFTYDWTIIAPSREIGYDRALQEVAHFQPILRSPEVSTELQIFGNRQSELEQTADSMVHMMDEDQREVFHTLYDIVTMEEEDRQNKMTTFFIEGKPGGGKTFVTDALACKLRSEGHIVLMLATSPLAATLYERGRTAHSLFR